MRLDLMSLDEYSSLSKTNSVYLRIDACEPRAGFFLRFGRNTRKAFRDVPSKTHLPHLAVDYDEISFPGRLIQFGHLVHR